MDDLNETNFGVNTAHPKSLYGTLAIAMGYVVGAQLGFQLALLPDWNTTLLWPPSGVALAAVLLGGRRTLPGIFLGAFVTTLSQFSAPFTPLMLGVGLAISASSTLSALAAGKMLKRIAPEEAYDKCLDKKKFRSFLAHPPEDEEM